MILLPRIASVYVSAGAASILFFAAGTTTTWSTGEIPKLLNATENHFGRDLSSEEVSWISSLLALGSIFGPLIFGYLADKIGRKNAMLCVGVPFLVSYVLMSVGTTVEIFYIARILAGISVGGTFILLPMYLSEISESQNRGLISCAAGCACCLGLLCTVCLAPYKSIGFFNTVMAIPPLTYLLLFGILGVESPVYLVKTQQSEKAELALKDLGRSPEMVKKDIMEMQSEYQVKDEPFSVLDIFSSKALLKGILSSLGLLIFQQLSGINAIMFYSAQIFKEAGTTLEPHYCSMILVFVQFVSSFIAPFLVERSGRKVCLLISAVGMVLSEGTVGLFCHLKHLKYDLNDFTWVPIVALTTFIIFFNIGYGPLPWVIMAEMFSTKYRSFASAFVATLTWIASFVITKCFDSSVLTFGLYNVFFFYTFCVILSIAFSAFYLVETKGKSLQEIQEILNK